MADWTLFQPDMIAGSPKATPAIAGVLVVDDFGWYHYSMDFYPLMDSSSSFFAAHSPFCFVILSTNPPNNVLNLNKPQQMIFVIDIPLPAMPNN